MGSWRALDVVMVALSLLAATLSMTVMCLALFTTFGGGVKDGSFTFTEEEFKESYEKTHKKIMPRAVSVRDDNLYTLATDRQEALRFVETSYDMTGEEVLKSLAGSIEVGSDDIPFVIDGKKITIHYSVDNGEHFVMIKPVNDE